MELFKNIKEFPEYTVYSDGRILTKNGNFMSIGRRKSNSGYIQVRLFKDNKYYYRYLHRILAEAFIENPNNYRTVNHKDGNKLNNALYNLEWSSDEQQQRHAYLIGLKHNGISFTDKELFNIYEMFFIKHLTPKKISMILNRPFGAIRKICYGERCNDVRKKFLENTEIK